MPSLVSAIHGAKHVVVTDYPDAELVENLQWNVDHCALLPQERNIEAKGYLWGAETDMIVSGLPSGESKFDILILADLLFNHSEHRKLVSTVVQMLKRIPEAKALVFFTPYRPWLLPNDLAFFDLVQEAGLDVDKFFEHTMEKVMFEEDPGVSVSYCGDVSLLVLTVGPGRAASPDSVWLHRYLGKGTAPLKHMPPYVACPWPTSVSWH